MVRRAWPMMHTRPSILPLRLDRLGFSAGGVDLLSDISLTVRPGRRLLVIGPNGAGKSLLLRLCHGLIQPNSGRVIWADGSVRPRSQAMVFQRPVLLRRSVRANLEYALSVSGMARVKRKAPTDAALKRFGLAPLARRAARLLSGGEQQRLAMARAWLLRPEIMFLDEPCSALDPGATRIIEETIAGFAAEGMTLMMTTHDLGQARRLADDIVFLNKGRLVEYGSAADFFDAPKTREASAFLAGDLLW